MPEHLTFDHQIGKVLSVRLTNGMTVLNNIAFNVRFNAYDTRYERDPGGIGLHFNPLDGAITNVSGRVLTLGVSYTVTWSNNSTNSRSVWIEVDGIKTNRLGYKRELGYADHITSGSVFFALQNGSTFYLEVLQDSGGALFLGGEHIGLNTGFGTDMQITVIK